MSRDPLIDMRSREDMRESYLDGIQSRPVDAPVRGGVAHNWPTLAMNFRTSCWCHDDPAEAAAAHTKVAS